MKKIEFELKPIHDTRSSFYKKATVFKVENDDDAKIYFLKSYDSVVACVIDNYFYLNNNIRIDLLFSNTTLRHIKEFYRQFHKDEQKTKSDFLKMNCLIAFDFLFRHETNGGVDYGIRSYAHYYNATSTETTRFFKTFQGYRQRLKQDAHGRYMFTKCIHGLSNYYYYYI